MPHQGKGYKNQHPESSYGCNRNIKSRLKLPPSSIHKNNDKAIKTINITKTANNNLPNSSIRYLSARICLAFQFQIIPDSLMVISVALSSGFMVCAPMPALPDLYTYHFNLSQKNMYTFITKTPPTTKGCRGLLHF